MVSLTTYSSTAVYGEVITLTMFILASILTRLGVRVLWSADDQVPIVGRDADAKAGKVSVGAPRIPHNSQKPDWMHVGLWGAVAIHTEPHTEWQTRLGWE